MKFDKLTIIKLVVGVVSIGLSAVSAIVAGKELDDKVSKEVAKALSATEES